MKQLKQEDLLQAWITDVGVGEVFESLARLCGQAAVFVVDRDRTIVFWGEGGERLLGFQAEDVVGQHCLKANRCQTCMVGCGVAEHGQLWDVPLTYYDAAGHEVRLLKRAQALYDDQGMFRGGVEVLLPVASADTAPAPTPVVSGSDHGPTAINSDVTRFHGLVSRDPAMLRAFQTIRNVAETEATALVRGESGSGKEGVARALHAESERRDAAFVTVNCAALTPSLIESELFGHVRGAFTGAVRDREGLFVQADGGTLFLDEVAELPMAVQAKLLRVLETGEVVPVGGQRPRRVDVRIVAATHTALRKRVAEGRFREDLLYRLRVVPIFLPPLRERRRDIELLLWQFIDRFNRHGPRVVTAVAPEAMRALFVYDWPGNVRELRNAVEFAFAVGRSHRLTMEDLPPEIVAGVATESVAEHGSGAEPTGTGQAGRQYDERKALLDALREADGHVGQAAAALGMSRATFWRRRKKLGI